MSIYDRDGCQVYWGSHGCNRKHGHEGPCVCNCCDVDIDDCDDKGCVAHPPYYGPETRFYGDDAEDKGLPLVPVWIPKHERS